MQDIKNFNKNFFVKDELGLLMQQLEEIENFYPCFKSMIKKE